MFVIDALELKFSSEQYIVLTVLLLDCFLSPSISEFGMGEYVTIFDVLFYIAYYILNLFCWPFSEILL